jgi:hypothetical protein
MQYAITTENVGVHISCEYHLNKKTFALVFYGSTKKSSNLNSGVFTMNINDKIYIAGHNGLVGMLFYVSCRF